MLSISYKQFLTDPARYAEDTMELGQTLSLVDEDRGGLILITPEEFRGMQATIELLGDPRMREKLLSSAKEECVELDWRARLKPKNT